MKTSLKINIFKFYLNTIIFLIILKLLFSYLLVRLSYFQRDLVSNSEAFNFLGVPAEFSNRIELILLPLLLMFILIYRKWANFTLKIILFSCIMFILNLVTGLLNNVSLIDSLTMSLKLFSPLYLFCAFVIYQNKTQTNIKPLLIKIFKLCIVLTAIAILFFNPTFNRLENYLPIYFDSVHTHSYVLVSIFIGISYFLYQQNKTYKMVIFLVFSFLFLWMGYNVRTALIMYLIYIITMLFLVSDIFKVLFVKLLVFIPLILILAFFIKTEVDINEISSGRTTMYSDKIDQLSTYNFKDWMFGRGYGSDLIVTDVWWWDKKGAHSDLITFVVENGILYLLTFVALTIYLATLTKKLNIIFISIILASFFASIISNGILVRPLANYIFCFVLSYVYYHIMTKNKRKDALLFRESNV